MGNKLLTDIELDALWYEFAKANPCYSHLPKLGRAHIQRFQHTPPNSLLLSYTSPDLRAVLFNETTEEEMRDAGIDIVQALKLSMMVMMELHGRKWPGAIVHHTLPQGSPYIGALVDVWNNFDGGFNGEWS